MPLSSHGLCFFCSHAKASPQPAHRRRYPDFFKTKSDLFGFLLGKPYRYFPHDGSRPQIFNDGVPRIFCHAFEDKDNYESGKRIDTTINCNRRVFITQDQAMQRAKFYRQSQNYPSYIDALVVAYQPKETKEGK